MEGGLLLGDEGGDGVAVVLGGAGEVHLVGLEDERLDEVVAARVVHGLTHGGVGQGGAGSELGGQGGDLLAQLVVRYDGRGEAELEGLRGGDRAREVEQLDGLRPADEPGEGPRGAGVARQRDSGK